jgi:hypothetical protein
VVPIRHAQISPFGAFAHAGWFGASVALVPPLLLHAAQPATIRITIG